ncbi:agam-like MADS-box protein AGL29 [Capsicum annuum]|uniref:agamous-like MADS-box protein AGL29 n=1 Tax=Capsicum annuum TaxID=4072 RepID=UPI0007BF8B55|nr:agamous-like MADS-box protein AGL29 [Capsicum annuum]
MSKRKYLGHRKIPVEKIENETTRLVTFSKRKSGLYKKVSKLVEKYDVNVGIISYSPNGKPYSFFHPTLDSVIGSFVSPDTQPSVDSGIVAVNARIKVTERRGQLDNLDIVEKIISNQTPDANDMENLWEYIDNVNKEDVKRLEEWLDLVDLKLNHKLMVLENGVAFSTQAPPNNAYQAYSGF